jgi:DNA-binding response OmpR family regulator
MEQEQKPLRLQELRNRLREMLVEQGTALTQLPSEENVAIVIHLFNVRQQANIPGQVVAQARRQALLELTARGAAPERAALARAVSLREF